MNPVAVFFGVIGLVLLVIAFRGKQDNLVAAFTGKPYGSSTIS